MSWPRPPAGFTRREWERRALYASDADLEPLLAAGFDRVETWERALPRGDAASGRGATAIFARAEGPSWRLKRMRRGGAAAPLWRDRYPSAGRLVAILASSSEAIRRGIAGAAPVALLLTRDAAGLVRGYAAFEEIEGAEDLASRVRRRALTRADLAAAMAAIRRLHDQGIAHPDLNLGNVLVRSRGEATEAFIIDLDRAAVGTGPLPFGRRQAAIRRIERSCAKVSGSAAPLGPGTEDLWYRLYAGDDAGLARRFVRGRRFGRLALLWHKASWKDAPR